MGITKTGKYKYVLTESQMMVLRDVHRKIMESGLIRLGIPFIEQTRFIETSTQTFDMILKESQEKFMEIGEKEEVMNLIKNS